MALKDIILGSNIWFAREGSTVGGIVVSPSALPVFSSTKADWLKLGSVEHWDPKSTRTWVDRRAAPAGKGKYQTRTRIPLSSKLSHAFALQEFSALEFELLLNAASIHSTTGAYVPNSAGAPLVGWLHLENYDQNDVKILDDDSWVQLGMESYQFGEKLDPHTLMAEVLYNSLNAGHLTGLV